MENTVLEINTLDTKINSFDVSKVLLQIDEKLTGIGPDFSVVLANAINNLTLESREEMLDAQRRLYDAHAADKFSNRKGGLTIAPNYSLKMYGEGDSMSLSVRIDMISGHTVDIKISMGDNMEDCFSEDLSVGQNGLEEHTQCSLKVNFPNTSCNLAKDIEDVFSRAGLKYKLVHAVSSALWQKSNLSKRTKKLLRLANDSKSVACDGSGGANYELSNMIFNFLVQNKDFEDCKLVLYKERGETPYHDLLVLRHEDGEELRVPAPAWPEDSDSVSEYRKDRKPVGKNKKDLCSDEGGEYYNSLAEKAYWHMSIMILNGGAKVVDYTNWI